MNDTRFAPTPAETLTLKGKDRGFTIIELLVVMAIIGLLAAIAIPVFQNLKNNAYDAAAQSDLRQAALAIEAVHVEKEDYPVAGSISEVQLKAAPYNVKFSHPQETVSYATSGSGEFIFFLYLQSRSGQVFVYNSGTGLIIKNVVVSEEG